MRIVSICPSNTELLVELGLWHHVVGLDDYSDWPESVKNLPRVGRDLHIDMERVTALRPDLVVASLSVPGMERNIAELDNFHLPYIILNPKKVEEIAQDMQRLAQAAGVPERGEQASHRFMSRLERLASIGAQAVTRPTLYWEWWPNPVYTPGAGNWLSQVSHYAGGRNLFDDYTEENVKTDHETVRRRNPDYILAVWTGVPLHQVNKEKITGRTGWSTMASVALNRVHILEEGLFCRPSQRLLDGLEKLITLIHPDLTNS